MTSLNAISASKKKPTSKKKKLDSVNTLLTPNSVLDVQINQFPVYSHKHFKPLPTVVYIQHEEEANELIAGLKAGPIAFDMEWRLLFRRAKGAAKSSLIERRTAVVQVADSSGLILVIQTYYMSRFPIELRSLLENPEIPKIGVNILNDGKKLFRDHGILAKNLVELGALALLVDPVGSQERSKSKRRVVSLVKLVRWYCGMEVDKGKERISDWEMKLESEQIDYAANDVHSSMVVYQKLCNIAQLNAITLADKKSAFTSDVESPSSEIAVESPSSSEIAVESLSSLEVVVESTSSSEVVESTLSSEAAESPSSSEVVESTSSSEVVESPSSKIHQDQSNQSSTSVYGRLMRRVLGLKALLKSFFVKP